MATIKSPEITKKLFGGVLNIDGAGQYAGLELINFVVNATGTGGILPADEKIKLKRIAHDFARRLSSRDETLNENVKRDVLIDEHSEQAIIKLLRCLELEVPNAVQTKSWSRTHFFPYTRGLIHWDARIRNQSGQNGRVQLERRYFRGGGAYAFKVLRLDHDHNRLEKIKSGFAALYPDTNHSPLDLLACTLERKGISDELPNFDEVETESRLIGDHWEDLYRNGVLNILSHTDTSTVERVRATVTWTGLWLVFMMSGRTASKLEEGNHALLLDCAGTNQQLRRASQRSYRLQISNIEEISQQTAAEEQANLSSSQMGHIRGFYGNTAVSCGLGNAWKGRRHFLLKLDALKTLVMAALSQGNELEFERFITEWLFKECRLAIGRHAASELGLLNDLDATIFEENESSLASQLNSAGLLKVYSDATRMVSAGEEQ
jgi:hypothetical protein